MPIKVTWRPLFPGENPGDPELGGWRPLRIRSFRGFPLKEHCEIIDLLTAIKQIGHMITCRNLKSAITFIGGKVTQNNRTTMYQLS